MVDGISTTNLPYRTFANDPGGSVVVLGGRERFGHLGLVGCFGGWIHWIGR